MSEQQALEKAEARVPAEWEWETHLGKVKLSVDIVRRYFCPLATEPEIMHFIAVCRYHGLNPYLREAYLIKYDKNEAAQIVVGKDAHAKQAEDHPAYKGDEGGIIVQTAEGKVEERTGEFYTDDEKLLGGWAVVYRTDRDKPKIHRVRLKDWDKGRAFWKSSPAHMIAKVAMSQARHEAFPKKYSGLLSEEEVEAGRAGLVGDVIAMPLSNAEAAAQQQANGTASSAGPEAGECRVLGQDVQSPPAGDPSPEEQAAIRAQEQAEAGNQQPPPSTAQKVDRGMIWNAVLRKAKVEKKTASAVLQALTGAHNMTALNDEQVLALAKKL